jgi:hypothetical protein
MGGQEQKGSRLGFESEAMTSLVMSSVTQVTGPPFYSREYSTPEQEFVVIM